MTRMHHYTATISWRGNLGKGTAGYSSYSRNHDVSIAGKPTLPASADAAFRGDRARYTPEDLLVSSLSGCHMLWYLHLCAEHKIVVLDYVDHAVGVMEEIDDGSGQFRKVTLHPRVTVAEQTMMAKAQALHSDAHRKCFIARSVNFPIEQVPEIICYDKT
jgi:organic hydroperoxide reductase OsmC/OhrA